MKAPIANTSATALGSKSPVAQPPGVRVMAREQTSWSWDARQQLGHACQIMCLAQRQVQRNGPPPFVGQGMLLDPHSSNLRFDCRAMVRPSHDRPMPCANSPHFPPEAEWGALINVLTALVVPTTPVEPDKTWQTSSYTSYLDHR